ncbi:MAG: HEPN domain-containing protein, partial [Ignavibacteriota bacterium]
DFLAAEMLFQTNKRKPYELVCFHSQQCVEKYMKALLIENDIQFEKTHRLGRLLNLLNPILPQLELHREALLELSNYASETRYPGEYLVSKQTASDAFSVAKDIREILRLTLEGESTSLSS